MDLPQLTCELILDLVHVDPVAARALVHADRSRPGVPGHRRDGGDRNG